MGYWTSTQDRFKIRDYSNHPWADTLKKSLAAVEPQTLAELEANGELNAFLSVKVDECMKNIRTNQQVGMDYEAAKESAFDSMLPKEPEDVEDWEREGAEQDAIDGFSDWIGKQSYGGSQPDLDDQR